MWCSGGGRERRAFAGVDLVEDALKIGARERPLERAGDVAVVLAEVHQVTASSGRVAKSLGVSALRWMIEK